MTDETWKPIPGFEHYEASDLGRVRSLGRWVRSKGGSQQFRHGRVMTPTPDAAGYLKIKVGGRYKLVHQLVLLAFVGPPGDGQETAHGDGNRANCALSNLRYATHRENVADKRRHGTAQTGERHGMARLSAAQVAEIRRLKPTHTLKQLSAQFGICPSHVSDIVRGAAWV